MQIRFSSAVSKPPATPAATRPPMFQGKSKPNETGFDVLKMMAESGNAQAQLDYGMYLYDNKVPRRVKLKANVLIPLTLGFAALIPPLRIAHNPGDDTLECYKWLYLASLKKKDIGPNMVESWLKPLNLVLSKKDIDEAIRRANVWRAEFDPEHRGGDYTDELRKALEAAKGDGQ